MPCGRLQQGSCAVATVYGGPPGGEGGPAADSNEEISGWEGPMSEDKDLDAYALEMSELCQRYESDGAAVQIEIYRGEPNGRWLLEIVDDHWNSTVWDDEFESEQAALDAALQAIEEEGIQAMIGPPNA